MQRLRVSTVAAALTVLALFMVGVVLAQAPTAPAPLAQVATPRAVQATTTGGDYPRQVYVALADTAVSHVIDLIQTMGAPGTTGTTGATGTTGGLGTTSGTAVATAPARVGTPVAAAGSAMSLTATQPVAELVVNMRAVLGVAERALDDLEAMNPSAACSNLADDVRDADVALLDVQRTLRRATTGPVTLETRLMNQLTRARSNLLADMTCLTAGTTSGGLGVGTPSAPAVGTPSTVTPLGTATVRPAASNTNSNASSSASNNSGPLDAISRFLQSVRERLGGGGPTPTPRPTR